MKGLILILIFVLCSWSLFRQKDSLSMPDKMISLNAETNIFYSEIGGTNVFLDYYFTDPPQPGTLTKSNTAIKTQTNVGYHINLSFKKKITHFHYVNLYLGIGLTYKYLNTFVKYSSEETYHYKGYDSLVVGNGQRKWREQYLSPLIALSLYSKLSKRIYIETSIIIDYNFLISQETYDDYKGQESAIGSAGFAGSDYERHNKYSEIKSKVILNRLEGCYAFGIGYNLKRVNIGIQYKSLLPNIINLIKGYSTSNMFYDRSYYNQSIISLQLNYYLK